MTLGNIFGSAMGPTSSSYYNRSPSVGEAHQIMSERDGSGYSYSFPKKSKWKFKSDKKHAAMSALTLLAFLFFLNILQNCLKEQIPPVSPEVTMMMMMPAPQKNIKDSPTHEGERGGKNDGELAWVGSSRRSRSLLQVSETTTKPTRHMKFIQDFKGMNHNWANGLSQLTEKELENQRIKTDNLQSYLKRLTKSTEESRPSVTVIPLTEGPKSERLLTGIPFIYKPVENDWMPKVGPIYIPIETTRSTVAPSVTKTTKIYPVEQAKTGETRNRRSDVVSSEGQSNEDEVQTVTPSSGIDISTYKTYPVYNYYNHKQEVNLFRENRTDTWTTPHPSVEISRVSSTSPATMSPTYTIRPPGPRYPPLKNRFKYGNNHYHNRYYQHRYPVDSRYKYSPYRKMSNYYEPSPGYQLREGYYPMAVVREPEEDEPGFDLVKFVRTMLTSFAKPLSKMVSFAKVGSEELQCYELILCEAHRVSRLMGPTAEAVASTVSTLFTWYAPKETRPSLIDAINSGRANTCQQQIIDCDERSGGKSAMTVIAQVLETKLR